MELSLGNGLIEKTFGYNQLVFDSLCPLSLNFDQLSIKLDVGNNKYFGKNNLHLILK